MASAWRIVNARHQSKAFTGEGARQEGGRWNSTGSAMIYLAEYRSLALLEILAHARSTFVPSRYVLIDASWHESMVEHLPEGDLPLTWRSLPLARESQTLGDRWIKERRSAILSVPNAIIPAERNYLINPAHPDFRRIKIGQPAPFDFDLRLLKG